MSVKPRYAHCATPDIAITTTGASLGAYHAVNSLLKHPQLFRRTIALSGVYDLRRFMDGDYDDNFYFNNPVDYVQGLSDPWYLEQLAQDDIRLVTGNGPFEDSRPTYQLSGVLWARGIRHAVGHAATEIGLRLPCVAVAPQERHLLGADLRAIRHERQLAG